MDLYIVLLSKIWIESIFGANFSESVGPNKTIIGILANPIMCITPLSIDIAKFNLEANAVTRAGHAIFEWCSGNKALGNLDLILFTNSVSSFFTKNTGTWFISSILVAIGVSI